MSVAISIAAQNSCLSIMFSCFIIASLHKPNIDGLGDKVLVIVNTLQIKIVIVAILPSFERSILMDQHQKT